MLVTKNNNHITQCTSWQGLGSHLAVSHAQVSSSAHFLAVPRHQKYPASVIRVKLCRNSAGFLVERTHFHLICCRILDLSQIRISHRQGELRDNGQSATFLILYWEYFDRSSLPKQWKVPISFWPSLSSNNHLLNFLSLHSKYLLDVSSGHSIRKVTGLPCTVHFTLKENHPIACALLF